MANLFNRGDYCMEDKNEEFLGTSKFSESENYYFHLNYKLSRRNRMLIIALILLISINVYLAFGLVKRNKVIDAYFHNIVSLSKHHIAGAHTNMKVVERSDDINSKIRFLIKTEENLDAARSCIRSYSIYYNFKSTSNDYYIGNGYASSFFEAYIRVLQEWTIAFQKSDKNNIPSEEEIKDYISDLTAIANEFSVYANMDYDDIIQIEDLDYEELHSLFTKLAKETRTEKVKNELKSLYFHD